MPSPTNQISRRAATRLGLALACAGILASLLPAFALAEDMPTFTLEMKDGTFTPDHFTVPAGKTVKIIVKNTGTTPAEFESRRLRKEKVLGPGAESFVVLRRLSPGEYTFFDDFHPDAGQGVIKAE